MLNLTPEGKISNLAKALLEAQKALAPALKSSLNPHFKSRYADLSAVFEVAMPALHGAGLTISQHPLSMQHPNGDYSAGVETILMHAESGEFIMSRLDLPIRKASAQDAGSALTYARRYAIAAIVGVATEDDDGNRASRSKVLSAPKPDKATRIARMAKYFEAVGVTTDMLTSHVGAGTVSDLTDVDVETLALLASEIKGGAKVSDTFPAVGA